MKRKTMCYYIYKVLSSIYNSDISEIKCFNAPNTILLLLMLSSGLHCIILCINKIWNNNCSDYYFIFCIVEWYNMRLWQSCHTMLPFIIFCDVNMNNFLSRVMKGLVSFLYRMELVILLCVVFVFVQYEQIILDTLGIILRGQLVSN